MGNSRPRSILRQVAAYMAVVPWRLRYAARSHRRSATVVVSTMWPVTMCRRGRPAASMRIALSRPREIVLCRSMNSPHLPLKPVSGREGYMERNYSARQSAEQHLVGCGGLDQGIGHSMLFEVDSAAQAPVPPIRVSRQTLSAVSDRKSAPQLSSRPAG